MEISYVELLPNALSAVYVRTTGENLFSLVEGIFQEKKSCKHRNGLTSYSRKALLNHDVNKAQ